MTRKTAFHLIALCLVVFLLLGWCADKVFAAAAAPAGKAAVGTKAAGGKNDVMEKKGIEGLFKGKGLDASRAPSKAQKWLGIGSIAVMIIVVKYL